MTLRSTILQTEPTSYWPLDDEVPFGAARMPHFDGRLGQGITIPNDERYSHAYANALSVACWIAPSVLNERNQPDATLPPLVLPFQPRLPNRQGRRCLHGARPILQRSHAGAAKAVVVSRGAG